AMAGVRTFTGGSVPTRGTSAPIGDGLLMDGETIPALGGLTHLDHPDAGRLVLLDRPDAAAAERVDLGGAVLVPGLIDAHNHLSVSALHPHWHDVRGVGDRAVLVEAIHAQATAGPDTVGVRCQGIDLMGPGAGITRHDL